MDLIKYMKNVKRSPRFRDKRGHYASAALKCLRDQYWAATGEKETNPSDFVGRMKMLVGSGVEYQLVKEFLGELHWQGIHMIGTQVQVGGTAPAWDGNLDALVHGPEGSYVIEIKTKSGYGADMLYNQMQPSDDYLAQLGLYLRDLDSKGITNKGCLLYVLMSDKHFGELLQFYCEYNRKTNKIVCNKVVSSTEEVREVEISFDLDVVLQRWQKLDKMIAEKKCPPGDYIYKYPLTKELLDEQSDSTLAKMLDGTKILGQWQPRYSAYFDKILATDGISREYSSEEISLIRSVYRERHPKSRK